MAVFEVLICMNVYMPLMSLCMVSEEMQVEIVYLMWMGE